MTSRTWDLSVRVRMSTVPGECSRMLLTSRWEVAEPNSRFGDCGWTASCPKKRCFESFPHVAGVEFDSLDVTFELANVQKSITRRDCCKLMKEQERGRTIAMCLGQLPTLC